MKHLIVINPNAGLISKDVDSFVKNVKDAFEGLDYEIYFTTAARSATTYLREYFKNHSEPTRVYACGGDGTIHEVTNGIVGVKNVELAILAMGTGNDFVKTYGTIEDFQDIKAAINGKVHAIDLSKISGGDLEEPWYSINVINFGFDAIVGARGNYYKQHGIPSDAKKKEKNEPYTYALNHDAMKHGRFNDTEVFADDEKLNEKQILLGTIAQGHYVGGKFHCAPKSDNTDGLMDVCVLKTMTFLGLGMIIGTYTKGKHLNRKRRKIVYRRAKKVVIKAPKVIDVCVDGEMTTGQEFLVEVVPAAINLVLPK